AALLKVASRCNLDCDYCYVYKHADQTWRSQPTLMSDRTVAAFAARLRVYIETQKLDHFSVIFHGGEPLLFGAKRIIEAVERIRAAAPQSCEVEFSLQTNGVLLTPGALEILRSHNVAISLSLDGPREVHDTHRLNHVG